MIHLGTPPPARNTVTIDGARITGAGVSAAPRARVRIPARHQSLHISAPFSWATLMDGVLLLGVVWSIPLVVLIVGAPFALALAFLLWAGRAALSAF